MSPNATNLLSVIAEALPRLNKSEQKVASVILKDPESATQSSIAVLAKAANVSEPSVNRFCKKFDAKGFPDFKLKLAQSMVSGMRYLSQHVDPDDDVASYTGKIFDSAITSLALVRDRLCLDLIDRVADKMIQARRIYFFGLGASSAVAKDAEHKFFRFNLPVSFHEDVLMQRMLASSGKDGDVFFIISYTGRTREMVESARLARKSGATVIGLTAPNSPLAAVCHLAIEVAVAENTDQYVPMTSRIVQLVVLDVLATGVTIRRGPEFQPYLKKIKDSLKSSRFSCDE
nr:putative transcriptional regulator HexR [uncultured bacterium]